MSEKDKIIGLLGEAGVTVNGREPWDIQIHDERTWTRVFAQGSLGLGEAYMDGWWDAADLAEFFNRVLRARVADKLRVTPNLVWQILQARLFNMQTVYGDPRYRPSPWLRRRGAIGLSLTHVEE